MPCPLMAIITGKEFAIMCLPPRLIDKWCWWHSERKCYWNTPEILIQTLDSQFIFQFLMLWKAIEIRYPVDLFNTTASARQHVEEFALMPLSPKLMFMALWNKMLLKAPKLTIRPLILNSPFSFASMKGNKILYTGECCFRAHALLILVMQRSSSGTVVVVFLRVGAYSRWALITFSTFSASVVCLFCNKIINSKNKTRRCNKARFL